MNRLTAASSTKMANSRILPADLGFILVFSLLDLVTRLASAPLSTVLDLVLDLDISWTFDLGLDLDFRFSMASRSVAFRATFQIAN